MNLNPILTLLVLLSTLQTGKAQWQTTTVPDEITNTNPGNVRLNPNSFLIARGHVFFYPYEGENNNGTAYIQARTLSPSNTSINFQFRTQNNGQLIEALHIRSDGNVGIGTSNANARLQVNGNLSVSNGKFSSLYSLNTDGQYPDNVINEVGNSQLSLGANWIGGQSDLALINSNIASGGITFWQQTGANTKKMLAYFRSNGNVGIGNPNPPTTLSVSGDIYSRGHMYLHAYEGENTSGTAYIQARDFSGNTSINLQLRTQNSGQIVEAMHIRPNGNVGIGTSSPGNYRLAVEGTVGAREVKVTAAGWADFVFNKNYVLPRLTNVEKYINQHGHLPDIPSEAMVKAEGIAVGEMQTKLLQKIEELTLYLIQQDKEIKRLKRQVKQRQK